ncbi:hypothetical protein Taro_026165, partial [Colocasia esculenta]|nr:hypothetical protein [Colocasia esculenta]
MDVTQVPHQPSLRTNCQELAFGRHLEQIKELNLAELVAADSGSVGADRRRRLQQRWRRTRSPTAARASNQIARGERGWARGFGEEGRERLGRGVSRAGQGFLR